MALAALALAVFAAIFAVIGTASWFAVLCFPAAGLGFLAVIFALIVLVRAGWRRMRGTAALPGDTGVKTAAQALFVGLLAGVWAVLRAYMGGGFV